MDSTLLEVLQRPGNLVFEANRSSLPDLSTGGGSAVRQDSGHLIMYGAQGRRILATDPDGNPLHECEWSISADGGASLTRARFLLDWGQWVGLKPGGTVRSTTLDLSSKPGWERLRADDLRRMASQAMGVPLDEVRFFYSDEDLVVGPLGQATIRHRKDAFYVLDDGTFATARFMACMGAMHWGRIDFLPVVELFQSLLPGTGSAAFELIRGLYDDQNPKEPLPLRYRGIPTYPSEAAYRLFSAFFFPRAQGGGDPFPLFMEAARSHEVTWWPDPRPPRRYFDSERRLCVTIKDGAVQKATSADDSAGLSFTGASQTGFAPCGRQLHVEADVLELHDGEKDIRIPARPAWGKLLDSTHEAVPAHSIGWRSLLGEAFPQVAPAAAFSAVLLYPEDGTEIEERASQPFVADHIQDSFEQDPQLGRYVARAGRVLVDNLDGALGSCLHLDRPRQYTVLYQKAAFAQKAAQGLWNQLARSGRLDWAREFTFLPAEGFRTKAYEQVYDLIYVGVLLSQFDQEPELSALAKLVARALTSGGLSSVVGPAAMAKALQAHQLRLLQNVAVEDLPTFHMHLTILPHARLKPGLTLFLATTR